MYRASHWAGAQPAQDRSSEAGSPIGRERSGESTTRAPLQGSDCIPRRRRLRKSFLLRALVEPAVAEEPFTLFSEPKECLQTMGILYQSLAWFEQALAVQPRHRPQLVDIRCRR
jgi:hypothetical protein